MTALSHGTRRKLSLLQLASELDNVSKACRIMGFPRDTFYEVRRAFQVGGVAALVEQRRGPRGPHPTRVHAEVETRILADALEHPSQGRSVWRTRSGWRGRTSVPRGFGASGCAMRSRPGPSGCCASSATCKATPSC